MARLILLNFLCLIFFSILITITGFGTSEEQPIRHQSLRDFRKVNEDPFMLQGQGSTTESGVNVKSPLVARAKPFILCLLKRFVYST